ncbi:hypothetical protein LCGC14_0948100 [marine sediment metagenome]|uniref:Uncharacterized protein n=1 Tax=marine sediment metagenome TaxID=412755 RepID=A0A0F9NMV7_9ZZZZ
MERGKERAEIRTGDLKRLLGELENRRDQLMDEVAKKQGECDMVERIIKRTYEIILDANKDEQVHEETEALDRKNKKIIAKRKNAKKIADKENEPRKKKVEKALNGIKNHTRVKETQKSVREGRIAAKKNNAKKDKKK